MLPTPPCISYAATSGWELYFCIRASYVTASPMERRILHHASAETGWIFESLFCFTILLTMLSTSSETLTLDFTTVGMRSKLPMRHCICGNLRSSLLPGIWAAMARLSHTAKPAKVFWLPSWKKRLPQAMLFSFNGRLGNRTVTVSPWQGCCNTIAKCKHNG